MFQRINDIPQEILVNFGGFIGAIVLVLGGAWASVKGRKKHPVEVGSKPPKTDLNEYILEETRGIHKQLAAIDRKIDERFAESRAALEEGFAEAKAAIADTEHRLEILQQETSAVRRDTSVLKDRGQR